MQQFQDRVFHNFDACFIPNDGCLKNSLHIGSLNPQSLGYALTTRPRCKRFVLKFRKLVEDNLFIRIS